MKAHPVPVRVRSVTQQKPEIRAEARRLPPLNRDGPHSICLISVRFQSGLSQVSVRFWPDFGQILVRFWLGAILV